MKLEDITEPQLFDLSTMDTDRFIDWCEKNSPRYLERIRRGHRPIYRGSHQIEKPFGLFDPKSFERRSANTDNYYNLWMSNHPMWSKYPKRNRSMICSISFRSAMGYGIPYLVIPPDSADVGVCPRSDLWESFEKTGVLSLEDLMSTTKEVFRKLESDNAAEEAGKNYRSLLNQLKKTKIDDALSYFGSVHISDLLTEMKASGASTLYDFYEFALDPDKNDFSVELAGSLKTDENVEVWIGEKSAMVCVDTDAKYSEREILEALGIKKIRRS